LAGLFLFVPLLERIDLQSVVPTARLPGSKMIPAAQAVGSLLALKLTGAERKSHVMDLVMDEAIALFAGINVVPNVLPWPLTPPASTTKLACGSWTHGCNRQSVLVGAWLSMAAKKGTIFAAKWPRGEEPLR
jgi:hypothetical protein